MNCKNMGFFICQKAFSFFTSLIEAVHLLRIWGLRRKKEKKGSNRVGVAGSSVGRESDLCVLLIPKRGEGERGGKVSPSCDEERKERGGGRRKKWSFPLFHSQRQ